jgi:RimJ/RimL family protein N-acetyltransferase
VSRAGADALFEDLGAVRAAATEFTTNFFATPEDVQAWLNEGMLRVLPTPGARTVLRADAGFAHVYHWAASVPALRSALAGLPAASTLVTDVIGKPEGIEPIERAYRDAGFTDYQALARMSRVGAGPGPGAGRDPSVRTASEADVPRIDAFFRRILDPYSDQIPAPGALREFADRQSMLVVDRGNAVAGVLIFDARPAGATLRYWWLAPEFRNQGIGAALIKTMFHELRDARRIQLWVVADNADAIAKYEHYGFRRDGLVDRILIKRGN